MEIHVLVFDAAPETLDEHVVDPASLAVHADGHPMGFGQRVVSLARVTFQVLREMLLALMGKRRPARSQLPGVGLRTPRI